MVEFGAGGAIMHTEEPTTTTEPQPTEATETPAVDDPLPPTAATSTAGESAPAPDVVPEGEANNTDSVAAETSQTAAQPEGDADTATPSPPVPAPAPSATLDPSAPNDLLTAQPASQNPRRKRRAKGWSCPVCRQRKCSLTHLLVRLLANADGQTPAFFPFLAYTSLLRITTTPPTMEGGKEGKRVSTSTIDHPLATPASAAAALVVPTPALESTPEEPAALAPSRSLRPVFLRGLSRRAADPMSPV